MHGFKAFAFLALAFCATAKGESTECSKAVDCTDCMVSCKVCTIGKLATCSNKANCTDVKFGQTGLGEMKSEDCKKEAINYVPDLAEKDCKTADKKWCVDKETKKIGACVQAVKSCADVDLVDPEPSTSTSSTSKPNATNSTEATVSHSTATEATDVTVSHSTATEATDATVSHSTAGEETDATVAETTDSTVSLPTAAALVAAALAYVV